MSSVSPTLRPRPQPWAAYPQLLALLARVRDQNADVYGHDSPELPAVDAALADANLTADGIDRIFLTGGSSLVPAVRAIFHRRFASDRIETGAELESIAAGLALMGRERDLSRWTTRSLP